MVLLSFVVVVCCCRLFVRDLSPAVMMHACILCVRHHRSDRKDTAHAAARSPASQTTTKKQKTKKHNNNKKRRERKPLPLFCSGLGCCCCCGLFGRNITPLHIPGVCSMYYTAVYYTYNTYTENQVVTKSNHTCMRTYVRMYIKKGVMVTPRQVGGDKYTVCCCIYIYMIST